MTYFMWYPNVWPQPGALLAEARQRYVKHLIKISTAGLAQNLIVTITPPPKNRHVSGPYKITI